MQQHCTPLRGPAVGLRRAFAGGVAVTDQSTALTMSSMTFLASPNTIIVFAW